MALRRQRLKRTDKFGRAEVRASKCDHRSKRRPDPERRTTNKYEYDLFAANGTRISTYGTIAVTLNLSLSRAFTWRFVIADYQSPVIGMDFVSHYGLLLDPRNTRLIDTRNQLTARGYTDTRTEHP